MNGIEVRGPPGVQVNEPLEHGAGGDQGPPEPPVPPPAPFVQKRRAPVHVPCFHAVFATRQLASKGNIELYHKYSVRELFIYIPYVIILSAMAYAMTRSNTYYYTSVMADLFVDVKVTPSKETGSDPITTFQTSSDVHDFWNYLRGPMIVGMYWESWYGRTLNLRVRDLTEKEAKFGILYENQLMGVPRLRQLRVRKTRCPAADQFPHLNRICYPEYSQSAEDKGDLQCGTSGVKCWSDAPVGAPSSVLEAWQVRGGGHNYWGRLATYSGRGAVERLKKTSAETEARIAELQANLWITRATRAVFLDFTVYNANLNLFCVVKLLWEFPATGGVKTSYSLRTVSLIRYVSWVDRYIVLPCEILFCVFTLYYLIQEVTELAHLGCCAYIKDVWSWFDFLALFLSFFLIGFTVYRHYLVEHTLRSLTLKQNDFPDFEHLAYGEIVFTAALAISVFFAWLKVVFKYFSFNLTMTQLSRTLSRSSKDIFGFAIMFTIVFFAFAQLGYVLFGHHLEDYSTLPQSAFSLTRLIMGDFSFHELKNADRILGPIFFVSYILFIFFVLLNMLVAIINDTYSEVKAEIQAEQSRFELKDYFKGVMNSAKGVFGRRNRQVDLETKLKIAASEGNVRLEDIREHLREKTPYSNGDIEIYLSKYSLEREQQKVEVEDEEPKPTQPAKTPESPAAKEFKVEVGRETFERMEVEAESVSGMIQELRARLNEFELHMDSTITARHF